MENDQAIADTTLARFVDCWNHANGPGYRELYWPEAELVDPRGDVFEGADAVTKLHTDLWSTILAGSVIQGRVRKVRRLGPDHLVVDMDLEVTAYKSLPSGVRDVGGVVKNRLKHVMERRQGVWKILSGQNTALAGPAGPVKP
jgi:uncharacterized protein (TIGR02246 family)